MHDFWTNSNREYDVHQIAKLHKYGGIEHKKLKFVVVVLLLLLLSGARPYYFRSNGLIENT